MKRHKHRRLRIESLENRRVLAVTNLASITGVAFEDLTDDGLTGDDVRQVGETINLFLDGGNGTFDDGGGDDTAAGSTNYRRHG